MFSCILPIRFVFLSTFFFRSLMNRVSDTLPLCSLCFPFSQRAAGRPHGGGDSGGGGGGDGGGGGSDYGDEGRTLSQRLKRSATVYADDPIPTKVRAHASVG